MPKSRDSQSITTGLFRKIGRSFKEYVHISELPNNGGPIRTAISEGRLKDYIKTPLDIWVPKKDDIIS